MKIKVDIKTAGTNNITTEICELDIIELTSRGIEDVMYEEKGSKNREHLWRNTKAKLDYLHQLHIISKQSVYVGGYNISIPHMFVNSDWQDELKKLGWTFNIR